MSVKIGSCGLSDVFVGTASGKTNIDKIIVGNSDGTGTTVWERGGGETGPWNSGAWGDRSSGILHYDSGDDWFVGCMNNRRGESVMMYLYYYDGSGSWLLTTDSYDYQEITAPKTTTELNFDELLSFPPLTWSAT